MADNTTGDPGAGGDTFRLKDRAGVKTQIVGIDLAPGGSETLMNGVMPVSDNSGSLTVDAPVATPVFVRLSDGTSAIGTLAISAASLPLPSGASTAAKQPALGAAGTASADVLSIQGVASMTAVKVDGSAVTQPVSGTVTATGPLTDTQLRATPVPVSGSVTADTELPSAAALADATANPTVPFVGAGALLFNGSTWDRVRGDTANGVDVDVTRLPALVAGSAIIGALVANQTVNQAQVSGTAVAVGAGTVSTGVQRVTLASDQTTLTNTIGNVGIVPLTTGGNSVFHLVSAATTNATNVKASAGQLNGWYIYNSNATARKVVFHNTAGTPTAGASVLFAIPIPPLSAANVSDLAIAFGTGIAITTVTDLTDAGTTAVAASDLIINLFYK